MKKQEPPWIATVLIESNEQYGHTDNKQRLKLLLKILKETSSKNQGSGIILFPAGYFQTEIHKVNSSQYYKFTIPIVKSLRKIKSDIVICFGIDGFNMSKGPVSMFTDQIAMALNREGILACGRKFNPTYGEKEVTNLAKDYLVKEKGKSRIFELNGKKFYLAVCYDLYGIRQKGLKNPGVDGVLNCIHQFTARCDCETEICKCGSASGDVYWAKNGMAGASMKWGVPVYGAVVFYGRKVPERWPSGVLVDGNIKNTKTWCYEDNLIAKGHELIVVSLEETARLSAFNV